MRRFFFLLCLFSLGGLQAQFVFNGSTVGGGSGRAVRSDTTAMGVALPVKNIVEISNAGYQALTAQQKSANLYLINDGVTQSPPTPSAANVSFNSLSTNLLANDVQGAIDEIVNTSPTSTMNFTTTTSSYNLTLGDAKDNRIILVDYQDEEVLIPSGVFAPGHMVRIQSIGTGTAFIGAGSGVDILGATRLMLDSIYKGVTLARINSNTNPEEWIAVDGYIKASPCNPDVNELNTLSDASSDPNCNEQTGFSVKWLGTNCSVVANSDASVGNAAIKAERTATTGSSSAYLTYNIDVTAGDTFTVSFDSKSTAGVNAGPHNWYNCTGGPNQVDVTNTYQTYTFNITASATGWITLRWYTDRGTGYDSIGNNIFVDNLSIIKTTP